MLASLLPGIRHIRTPLAAGYLWLLALWLILAGHVASSGLPLQVHSLLKQGSAWHLAALGAAASLAALLLGMCAEGVYDSVIRFALRRALPDDPLGGFLGSHRLLDRFQSQLARLRSGPTKSGIRALKALAASAVAEAGRSLQGSDADLRDVVLEMGFVRGRDDRTLTDQEARDAREKLGAEASRTVRQSLEAWLAIRIIDQRDLLARRLVSDNPALFTDYNRLRSEAEFRLAVGPPLMAILASLAIVWTPWVLLAILALPVFLSQALRKGDEASDLLIDALLIGKVEAPALAQLSDVVLRLRAAT